MERETKDKRARVVVARNAIRFGRITDEGKAVYSEYLAQIA
jgi:archaeosine-15-forming tRNA-guanine transglycosylase